MRICHILYNDKFIKEFIDLINSNFPLNENVFIIFKSSYSLEIEYENIIFIERDFYKNIKLLKRHLSDCDKIILHKLVDLKLMVYLYTHRKYFQKVSWVIWGFDLYYYRFRKINYKSNIYEFVRKLFIRDINEIISLIEGDYKIAKKVYKTNAKYRYAFYPNPINFTFLDKAQLIKNSNKDVVTIQVGNSADPTNEHIEILDMLSKYKSNNIKIISPLSYGNEEYANKVIEYGNMLFGDKFKPLTKYMPPVEYSKILADIDIAIFNHQRQQALGNIIGLLYLEKKVYIRNDITPWDYFDGLGVKLYDVVDLEYIGFDNFINVNENIGQTNKKIIAREFSEEHCLKLWEKVLYGGE